MKKKLSILSLIILLAGPTTILSPLVASTGPASTTTVKTEFQEKDSTETQEQSTRPKKSRFSTLKVSGAIVVVIIAIIAVLSFIAFICSQISPSSNEDVHEMDQINDDDSYGVSYHDNEYQQNQYEQIQTHQTYQTVQPFNQTAQQYTSKKQDTSEKKSIFESQIHDKNYGNVSSQDIDEQKSPSQTFDQDSLSSKNQNSENTERIQNENDSD